jgi:anti-anti-sigma factor
MGGTLGDVPHHGRQDPMFKRHGTGPFEQPPPFTINSTTCPNGTVRVSLEGELDIVTAPELLDTLDELRRTQTWFVLDLRRLRFMDSTGLRAVIRVSRQVSADGMTMRIIRGPRLVQRVFEITGAHEMVEFVEAD